MRSSLDDAISLFNKFQSEGTVVRLGGTVQGVTFGVDGRIVAVTSESVHVRGRGCSAFISGLKDATFEYLEPRDVPVGFEERTFGSFLQVSLPEDGGIFVLAEFAR